MEGENTIPKELCTMLDTVFRVLTEERDQHTFNLMQNVVAEILERSRQQMNEVIRLN